MIDSRSVTNAVDTVAANLPALLGVVVRASIVLACAALVAALLRRASAATRHLVWTSAVLVALFLPLIGRFAPEWNARILPPGAAASAGAIGETSQSTNAATAEVRARPNAAPQSASSHEAQLTGDSEDDAALATSRSTSVVAPAADRNGIASWSLAKWVALVWMSGTLLVLARLAFGTIIVWNIARRAARVDDASWVMLAQRTARDLGITRPITLLSSPDQIVPVTWGVVYPIILLPASAVEWESERRSAVLVHELAHVGRLDALTQTLTQLAEALFWFNPLVWIAARQIRLERERACDDLVLSHGTRASFYADDLLTMVRTLTRNTEPAFAALAMARRTEFEGRMLAILDPGTDRRRLGRRGAVFAALASLAIALPVAALRPLPRDLPPARTSPSTMSAATAVADTSASLIDTTEAANALVAAGAQLKTAAGKLQGLGQHMGTIATCSMQSGQHTSIHSDDNGSSYIYSDDSRCLLVTSQGKITYSADESRVESISPGGHISITEVRDGVTRRYQASSENGSVVGRFYIDGKAEAPGWGEAWLKTVILRVIRQDATRAPARVARIRSQSGVGGVLTEINNIDGDYGKRAYFNALLESGHLTADTLRLITQLGARTLTSDYDKADFLKHAGALSPNANGDVLASAAASMSSAYYTREVMSAALASSSDKERVAKMVIAKTADMSSEYDIQSLLIDVLHGSKLSEPTLLSLIRASERISGEYYKAAVLDSVLATQSFTSAKPYLALIRASASIPGGDYYRAAVLDHIAEHHDIPPEVASALITATRSMTSDMYKANVLVAVAAGPSIRDNAVREAYFSTAKTIGSSLDYRRAMSAVLP